VIRKRGLIVATAVSIGLLVLAANLQPQPVRFWLLISGWPLLAWCAWIWSLNLPENSPYRGGFLFALFYLIVLGVIGRGLNPFFSLVFDPSGKHLYSLLTSKAFLGSAVVYFASVCVFYRGRLQETQEDLRYCRQMLQWNLDDADKLRQAEELDRPEERPTH
jgi:hypothetical protein